ncbi:MAG: DUF599 family protein [Pseudomonadota bacterium]
MPFGLTLLDLLAVAVFAVCYIGFSWAVDRGPLSRRLGLMRAVDARREQWMFEASEREIRIIDAQLLTTLSSGSAFFASTSLIVLGGLSAMLGAADQVKQRLTDLPFSANTDLALLELKILFLIALVIRAFFKFAWAFRLTHYLSIMIGSMPTTFGPDETDEQRETRLRHASKASRLSSLAALHTNGGMRTIYFAIAGLGWFINPLVFLISCVWVTSVVYRREFRSRALDAISDG